MTDGFDRGSGVINLKEVYVYNTKFGNDFDNEIGKVLYCYPSSTNEDRQLKQVGLCEAIIKFAENFSTKSPCESLHTQKSRYIYFEPEPDFWFVLILSVPSVIKSSAEGIQVTDYHNEEVQDEVFQAWLSRLYQRFVLRYGRLQAIINNQDLSKLKEVLSKFIDRILYKWEPNRAGILDIFFGLQFLPLSRQMFLRVQCFINNLLISWNQIKHALILQGDKLVWSGVGQRDIQVLYDFLLREAISPQFREGGEYENRTGMILTSFSSLSLTDPMTTTNFNSTSSSPESSSQGDLKKCSQLCHMCIYKSKQSYLVLIAYDDKTEFMRQLCDNIEEYLKQNFLPLSKDLIDEKGRSSNFSANGHQLTHRVSSTGPLGMGSGMPTFPTSLMEIPTNVKYIYFNHLNLSENTSPDCKQGPLNAYKLLADLKTDLSRMHENAEIVVKMASDTWIVAKVSNRREYYAIFSQRNSNILDIDEEMKKLMDGQLSNVFFQD